MVCTQLNVDDGDGVGGRTLIYERFNSLLQLSSLAPRIKLSERVQKIMMAMSKVEGGELVK